MEGGGYDKSIVNFHVHLYFIRYSEDLDIQSSDLNILTFLDFPQGLLKSKSDSSLSINKHDFGQNDRRDDYHSLCHCAIESLQRGLTQARVFRKIPYDGMGIAHIVHDHVLFGFIGEKRLFGLEK